MISSNQEFLDWINSNNEFLKTVDPSKTDYNPFPSHQFIDQFYFWLYKVKTRKLATHEQPWWVHAPTYGCTEWSSNHFDKIAEHYENWWNQNYIDRYDFLNQFYDVEKDLPFELDYYKSKFLNKYFDDFSRATSGIRYRYDWFMNSAVRRSEITQIIRDCENKTRESLGVPRIGEGWISEMTLYNFLNTSFEEITVIHHASPDFLGKQHYDIYFPDYKIAVEYQGVQHHRPVDYFGGEEAFKKNLERDARKKQISKTNNIILIEVLPNYDQDKLLKKIKKLIKNQS